MKYLRGAADGWQLKVMGFVTPWWLLGLNFLPSTFFQGDLRWLESALPAVPPLFMVALVAALAREMSVDATRRGGPIQLFCLWLLLGLASMLVTVAAAFIVSIA
jgi:hypothetical protein